MHAPLFIVSFRAIYEIAYAKTLVHNRLYTLQIRNPSITKKSISSSSIQMRKRMGTKKRWTLNLY